MENIEDDYLVKALFVFDLEFIGDVRNLSSCFIWEIAVFSVLTQEWFEMVIDPDPSKQIFPPPPIPEIPQLTREFLDQNQAVTWDVAFPKLTNWVDEQRKNMLPVFISHNTFRADKPIMELEGRRYSMHMPLNWYFFDSLHFSRRVIRNTNGNYSLNGLHEQIFGKGIENAHRAKEDVVACINIMQHLTNNTWQLQGPMYPVYSTALRTIRWIGQKAEQLLFEANIRSVEQLYMIIMSNARKTNAPLSTVVLQTLATALQNRLPKDNVKNIAQQLTSTQNCMYCHTFMQPVALRHVSPNPG